MKNVIVVYADCHNRDTRGDYRLAGQLACEIQQELNARNETSITVLLTSSLAGFAVFTSLYGVAEEGHLTISGMKVQAMPLEVMSPVTYHVTAYVEANRCRHPAAEVVKRVLSLDSKLLFVGAANQGVHPKGLYVESLRQDQPGVYDYFDYSDISVQPTGLGVGRFSLPPMVASNQLAALSQDDALKVPTFDYAFLYVNQAIDTFELPDVISQYLAFGDGLGNAIGNYVMVGELRVMKPSIKYAIESKTHKTLTFNDMPVESATLGITHYATVNHLLMRHLMNNAQASQFIFTTGVASTLEVMDKQIPFYQYSSHNDKFVQSYLMALKDLMSQEQIIPQTVLTMAELLFKPKPLSVTDFDELTQLSRITVLTDHMKASNKKIIAHAQGRVGQQLLSFIGKPSTRNVQAQVMKICLSLKKPNEASVPSMPQALRRAAAAGKFFELRALVDNLSQDLISDKDTTHKYRSPLHWAVIFSHLNCTDYLLANGADVNSQDKLGKTPLHYAIANNDKPAIMGLILAGALIDIPDDKKACPCQSISHDLHLYVEECLKQRSSGIAVVS